MLNLPTLRVLAAVLLIDPDDPDDADDLEAAGLLLARRVEREAAREEALPNRPPCVSCGDRRGTLVCMAVLMRRPLAAGHHRASTPTRPDPARRTTNQQASRT